MKRFIKFGLAALFIFGFVRATCGKPKPTIITVKPELKIKDYVYFHNMSITYDGQHYFTINGGNSDYCNLNEYNAKGDFITSLDLELDGRAIFYNSTDDKLYVKISGTDLYSVNLEDENAEINLNEVFTDDNSSPALASDNQFIYEFVNGAVRVLDVIDGNVTRTFSLDKYYEEFPYNEAIAASGKNIFVWGAKDEILVYDREGNTSVKSNYQSPATGFRCRIVTGCSGWRRMPTVPPKAATVIGMDLRFEGS